MSELCPMAIALLHYPVVNRRGEVVTSAVTNLDIHDLARLATTYNLSRFYLITPVAEQQTLVQRIVRHWSEGFGSNYNRDRSKAMQLIQICKDFTTAYNDWQNLAGKEALPVLTGAHQHRGIGFRRARKIAAKKPLLLIFGTGHGLAPQLYSFAWPCLAAVRAGGYNHLSVRTAAAIILDRLIGERCVPLRLPASPQNEFLS